MNGLDFSSISKVDVWVARFQLIDLLLFIISYILYLCQGIITAKFNLTLNLATTENKIKGR